MKIGIDYVDLADRGITIAELAKLVEDSGFESLFVSQRINVPASKSSLIKEEGHQLDNRLLDPFVALAAAATVTKSLKLGTGACYAALYDPIILAKQVATLDYISNGRFLFGVTPGWLEEEIMIFGIDPKVRWKILREKVLTMKEIWTKDEAEFHGDFVSFERILPGLKPYQKPHPPILVGSNGIHGMKRAIDYGDEWFPIFSSKQDIGKLVTEFRRATEDSKKSSIPITAYLWESNMESYGAMIEKCSSLGVRRCVVTLTYQDSVESAKRFLQNVSAIATT